MSSDNPLSRYFMFSADNQLVLGDDDELVSRWNVDKEFDAEDKVASIEVKIDFKYADGNDKLFRMNKKLEIIFLTTAKPSK